MRVRVRVRVKVRVRGDLGVCGHDAQQREDRTPLIRPVRLG